MKILYDGHIFLSQRAGGINRFFANLIQRLPEDFTPLLTTAQHNEVNYPSHPQLKEYYFQRWGFKPRRVSYWLERQYFRGVSTLTKPTLLHPTYYHTLAAGTDWNFFQCPIVLNVWDMIHEIFPEQMDKEGYQAKEKKLALESATSIICISQNTKNDLLTRYPQLDEKAVHVVYLASELSRLPAPTSASNDLYFLYVGGRSDYKNFNALLSAFAPMTIAHPEVKLYIVGSPLKSEELTLVRTLHLENHIHHCGFVDDQGLANLYQGSIAFVYPSLYEGFGIPLLEAMACGTPVIALNSSSIPEVVQDAGLLVQPGIDHELTEAMLYLLNNPSHRDQLIEAGYHQQAKFSWAKTASQIVEIYKSVA